MGRLQDLQRMVSERRLGFLIDEVMTGWHEFEPGFGEPGRRPMEFRVTWGATRLQEFLDPRNENHLVNAMRGYVDIDGLCREAPLQGTLELLYFQASKIRYCFNFMADGEEYVYVGEKTEIRPWNLHRTHTTCYGTLTKWGSDEVVSRSVTYFKLRTLPSFLASFRLG